MRRLHARAESPGTECNCCQERSKPIPIVSKMPGSFLEQTEAACKDLEKQAGGSQDFLLQAWMRAIYRAPACKFSCNLQQAQKRLRKSAREANDKEEEEEEESMEAKPAKKKPTAKAKAKGKSKAKASPKKKRSPKKKAKKLKNDDRKDDEDINSDALALEAEEQEIKEELRAQDERKKAPTKKKPGSKEAAFVVNRALSFSDVEGETDHEGKPNSKAEAHLLVS